MLGLRLRLYDNDRLGAENQGLQLYRQRDVVAGRRKVTALRGLLHAIVPGSRVSVHPVRFTAGPRQPRSPLVVLAVDTMAARRLLWEQLRGDAGLLLLLDLRLGRGLLRLHEVRKAAKRLRYAAESAVPVLDGPAEDLAAAAKHVQQVLGEHQDTVVARTVLRDMGARAHLDGDNGFSFGILHGLEEARAVELEADFVTAWKALPGKQFGK